MGCGCGSNTKKSAPGSWTVSYPDRPSESYRSEIEAIAAAARVGGATVSAAG